MHEAKDTTKSEFELDIFGQNPRLSRLYTQLCFAFSLSDTGGQSQHDVVDHLSQGLRLLSMQIPWLSGNVVQNSTRTFKIETSEDLPQLIVKDARHELPTFDKYRRAKFPFSMLDEKVIASCNTMPTQDDEDAPVLSLQLTFVQGGVLLVFSAQHNCMDMRGQSVLMALIAKACRGEPLSEEECKVVDLRGDGITPITDLDNANAIPEPSRKSTSDHQISQNISEAESSIWAYFNFSAAALSTLKTTAARSMTTDFVSTDDALSAFIWQSVTHARLYRLTASIDRSTFERQVDVRKHLGLPIDYIGNAVHKISNVMTVEALLEQPLGAIASQLRRSISPDQNLGDKARVAAAQLSLSLKNPMHNPAPARTTLPSTVIKMSSWAKEQCSSFDFGGPLGIAEAVRRPGFHAWEGLAYLLPKASNGDIPVALCLRDTDIDRLRCDETFSHFAEYIG